MYILSIFPLIAIVHLQAFRVYARVGPRTVTYSNTTTSLTPSSTSTFNTESETVVAETIYIHSGGEILVIASGTGYYATTVTKPGGFTVSVSEPAGQLYGELILPGTNSSDPHCQAGATFTPQKHYVTMEMLVAAFSDQTTSTMYVNTVNPEGFAVGGYTATVIGPTTEYITVTPDLNIGFFGPYVVRPGEACGGDCGVCQLYFPEVSVLYWPAASPHTACLSTKMDASISNNATLTEFSVWPRTLVKQKTDASTLVDANGFTFTSPSIYIAFPTISAYDECGLLGEVHTSTTMAFPPDKISTGVFGADISLTYYPFDPVDALCPPTSLTGLMFATIINPMGLYNPIISPLSELTDIDEAWGANCQIAAFQGNDPPFALTPALNIASTTLMGPSPVYPTASPSQNIPSQPIVTPQPETQTFNPSSQTSPDPIIPDSAPATPASQLISMSDPEVKTIAGQPVSMDTSSRFIIGTQTLTPGGAITISGTPFSFPLSSSYVITGTSKVPIASNSASALPQTLIFGGHTYTADSATVFVIGSQTVIPGDPAITISGSQISFGTLRTEIDLTSTFDAEVLTFAGETYTEDTASNFVLGTQTLIPGAAPITVSGISMSLAVDPTGVVIGTSTQGLASLILNGFAMTPNVAPFTGDAGKAVAPCWACWATILAVVLCCIVG